MELDSQLDLDAWMKFDTIVMDAAKELLFQMDTRKIDKTEINRYIQAAMLDRLQDKALSDVMKAQSAFEIAPASEPVEDSRCVIRVGTRLFTLKPEYFDQFPDSVFGRRLKAFPTSKFFDFPKDDPAVFGVLHDLISGSTTVRTVITTPLSVSREQIISAAKKYGLYELLLPTMVEGTLNAFGSLTNASHREMYPLFNDAKTSMWSNRSASSRFNLSNQTCSSGAAFIDIDFGYCTVIPTTIQQLVSCKTQESTTVHVYVLAPQSSVGLKTRDASCSADQKRIHSTPDGPGYSVVTETVWTIKSDTDQCEVPFDTPCPLSKIRIVYLHSCNTYVALGAALIIGKAAVRL